MRRKDREVTEKKEIINILEKHHVCRIGMHDEKEIYVVPLNYGYTWEDEKICFYFHSAAVGKKIEMLKKNPHVCIEIDGEHQLQEGKMACQYSYAFESFIGNGKVQFMQTKEEKENALKHIMKHQTGKEWNEFQEELVKRIAVFQVTIEQFSCKKNG